MKAMENFGRKVGEWLRKTAFGSPLDRIARAITLLAGAATLVLDLYLILIVGGGGAILRPAAVIFIFIPLGWAGWGLLYLAIKGQAVTEPTLLYEIIARKKRRLEMQIGEDE